MHNAWLCWIQLVSAAKIFDMLDSGDEQLDKFELYKMVRQVVLQKTTGHPVTQNDTMVIFLYTLQSIRRVVREMSC